jgi:hypothetical protein
MEVVRLSLPNYHRDRDVCLRETCLGGTLLARWQQACEGSAWGQKPVLEERLQAVGASVGRGRIDVATRL